MSLGLKFVPRTEAIVESRSILDQEPIDFKEPIFCPYQVDILTSLEKIIVVEKSRQIGLTWSLAFKAVYDCYRGYRSFVYTSYNLYSTKDFIKSCHFWAKLFNLGFEMMKLIRKIDNKNINIFELKFNNGLSISAAAGTAKIFRGKSNCTILIDEAAYREDSLDDILASALATLIHGGQIYIASTHCGIENEFNILVDSIKTSRKPYFLFTIPFKEALAQGLYKRIAIKQGRPLTPEGEKEFSDFIYSLYGERATEELDAIPMDYSDGGLFFQKVQDGYIDYSQPWRYIWYRYHDLASTPADKSDDNSFFSASVKIAFDTELEQLIVADYKAKQLDPNNSDNFIIETAKEDGNDVLQILEIEPGSTGQKWFEIMRNRLMDNLCYNVDGYKPFTSKITRLIPVANAALRGEFVVDGSVDWNREFKRLIARVSSKPQPLVTDVCDCISGIYDYHLNNSNYLS